MAQYQLDQFLQNVIRGHQLQAGSTMQEMGEFPKMLEAAGKETKSLWSRLVQMLYNEFILVCNVCSISICASVLGQLFYNGTQIVQSLKQWASLPQKELSFVHSVLR